MSLLVLALVFPTAPPALAQTPADKIVVPGNRVGQWALDMSVQELIRMNGPAASRPSTVATYVPRLTWYQWDRLGVAAGSHDRRTVEFLAVYETRELSTQRGVVMGSPRRAVLNAYGQPDLEGDIFVQGRIISVLVYKKIGLAVFADDAVLMLLVFRPGGGDDLIATCG